MKVFVLDIAKCNGCFSCQIACKDEHCGADWLPFSKAQPETGQFWMRVTENVRGQVPVVKLSYLPVLCAHCDAAPCAKVCSEKAFERRDDGLLILNPMKCNGCMACVDACPVDAVFRNDEAGVAQKCTGCAHLLDDGWTVPRCVDACATGALLFGDESEFAEQVTKAGPHPSLSGFDARVLYQHLPKRFVALSVVDQEADEVVIEAPVSVRSAAGEVVSVVQTDYMGDFFIDGLEPGVYTLTVDAAGYKPVSISADLLFGDLALGDCFVERV